MYLVLGIYLIKRTSSLVVTHSVCSLSCQLVVNMFCGCDPKYSCYLYLIYPVVANLVNAIVLDAVWMCSAHAFLFAAREY